MKRLLNILDWNSMTSSMSSLSSRITSLESIGGLGGLSARVTACKATDTSHNARITAAEAGLVAQNVRVSAIETWRAAKAPASANVSTNVTLPTALLVGLTSTVTKAGLEAMFNTVMGEVNGLKQILRDREILAT